MPRRRAIRKDNGDDAALRHSRDRHLGVCVSDEFYQRAPMFFSREGMNLELIGQYRGASSFLICNGPSFAGLDQNLLNKPGVITYGVNNGPKSFRPNFWTCVDTPARFLKSIWLDPKITKFVPMDHFEKKIFDNETWQMQDIKVGDCPNVIGFRRNEKFMAERFLFEDCMNWGNHKDYGGCRSVILPCLHILFLLGFRKVYLLGCDLTMSSQYAYHFDEQRDKGAVSCNNTTYQKMINEYFPQLKPYFDEEGFEVYNCNPNSALKVFPFIDFKDAITEATSKLGDTVNERTWGMYSKPEEKEKWKNELPEEQKEHLKVLKELKSKVKDTGFTSTVSNMSPTVVSTPLIPQPSPEELELKRQQEEAIRKQKEEATRKQKEEEDQKRKLLIERQKQLAKKKEEIEKAQEEIQKQIMEQQMVQLPQELNIPQIIPVQQKRVPMNIITSQQEG